METLVFQCPFSSLNAPIHELIQGQSASMLRALSAQCLSVLTVDKAFNAECSSIVCIQVLFFNAILAIVWTRNGGGAGGVFDFLGSEGRWLEELCLAVFRP